MGTMTEDTVPATARAIGEAIRQLRRGRNLSIEQLAERSAVSYQYVSEIETGKCNFSILILEKIAQGLDVSILALITAAFRPARPGGGELPRAA